MFKEILLQSNSQCDWTRKQTLEKSFSPNKNRWQGIFPPTAFSFHFLKCDVATGTVYYSLFNLSDQVHFFAIDILFCSSIVSLLTHSPYPVESGLRRKWNKNTG